jgi:hypothetical protein
MGHYRPISVNDKNYNIAADGINEYESVAINFLTGIHINNFFSLFLHSEPEKSRKWILVRRLGNNRKAINK